MRNARVHFLKPKGYNFWSHQKVCDALHYFWTIYLYELILNFMGQIVGTLMGTKCVPLVADMFCLLLTET